MGIKEEAAMLPVLGVDVSKERLDAALLRRGASSRSGRSATARRVGAPCWSGRGSAARPILCVEASGGYERTRPVRGGVPARLSGGADVCATHVQFPQVPPSAQQNRHGRRAPAVPFRPSYASARLAADGAESQGAQGARPRPGPCGQGSGQASGPDRENAHCARTAKCAAHRQRVRARSREGHRRNRAATWGMPRSSRNPGGGLVTIARGLRGRRPRSFRRRPPVRRLRRHSSRSPPVRRRP